MWPLLGLKVTIVHQSSCVVSLPCITKLWWWEHHRKMHVYAQCVYYIAACHRSNEVGSLEGLYTHDVIICSVLSHLPAGELKFLPH